MRTRSEVPAEKLRGGFYTPASLVDQTLARLAPLLEGRDGLRVLEPSAGDGAFIRGLARHLPGRVNQVTAVELLECEAECCRSVAAGVDLRADVYADDFLAWGQDREGSFDAAVGNPPFVRFQFIDDDVKRRAAKLTTSLDLPSRRVSNLWIAVLLGALSKLRDGGAFAFVIPAECFTGVSASAVRLWLVRHCEGVTFDIFPPGSFPDVLQEIVILSGVRRVGVRRDSGHVTVVEHEGDQERHWTHTVPATAETWTRYLLTPSQLGALNTALDIAGVAMLGSVAKFEVAAVTGANRFFSVDEVTVEEYDLDDWTVPLLPRIRHAPGLVYFPADHEELVRSGKRAALLHFGNGGGRPGQSSGAMRYIKRGEQEGLHRRYKTRIRDVWYEVPLVRSEPLLLSKRSHWYPRVVLNTAEAVTTDTIYRGWLTSDDITTEDFVAGFHNSMTLLSAEVEGRSFGGGVLELVPSEVLALAVPVVPGFGEELGRLDDTVRHQQESGLQDPLIEETNALLVKADVGITPELIESMESARRRLAKRRLDRTAS